MDDFKETLTTAICLLSMIIIFGMLILDIAGFGILQDPALQTVWYISIGLFFLSYLAIPVQAREGEVSRRWRPPLELEPSPTPRGVSPMESKPSQSSESRAPEIDGNMTAEAPSEPQVPAETLKSSEPVPHPVSLVDLEDVEAFGERALEQAKLGTLEQEALEQPTLEQTLEHEKMLERKTLERTLEQALEPTKEELRRLKEALGLDKGFLNYKRRGQGIYHVTYDKATKKYRWNRIGSWSELKAKLAE